MQIEKIKAQPFDCMQYFYGAVQEPRIRCQIRLHGHMSEAALRKAVNLSLEAVPLIGCVFDEELHCWKKCGFTDRDIVQLIEGAKEDDGTVLQYLLKSIDHTREPQLKIFLVREEKWDTLCIIINHMVCDGASFKEYLYLLCDLYSKCEMDPNYDKKPEAAGERSLNQLLRNLSLREKLDILSSKSNSQKPDPAMIMPIKGDPTNPIIVMTHIEKERFDAIRSFAKARNASVNDVLLTAYVRALQQATGCRRITVPCPVDLRKYKSVGQRCGFCNLTSNYWCNVEIRSGEGFEETFQKVSDQMLAQKASNECLKAPMLFHVMCRLLPFETVRKLFYKVSSVPVTSYTNLGILDDDKLRFGSHVPYDAFISTAVKKAPYFQLSISTYRGCCTLTSSMYGTENDRKFIGGFLEQITNGINII